MTQRVEFSKQHYIFVFVSMIIVSLTFLLVAEAARTVEWWPSIPTASVTILFLLFCSGWIAYSICKVKPTVFVYFFLFLALLSASIFLAMTHWPFAVFAFQLVLVLVVLISIPSTRPFYIMAHLWVVWSIFICIGLFTPFAYFDHLPYDSILFYLFDTRLSLGLVVLSIGVIISVRDVYAHNRPSIPIFRLPRIDSHSLSLPPVLAAIFSPLNAAINILIALIEWVTNLLWEFVATSFVYIFWLSKYFLALLTRFIFRRAFISRCAILSAIIVGSLMLAELCVFMGNPALTYIYTSFDIGNFLMMTLGFALSYIIVANVGRLLENLNRVNRSDDEAILRGDKDNVEDVFEYLVESKESQHRAISAGFLILFCFFSVGLIVIALNRTFDWHILGFGGLDIFTWAMLIFITIAVISILLAKIPSSP